MISHQHRFVFIHVPKCAGTSIKKHLEPYYREKNGSEMWHFPITDLYETFGYQAKAYFKFAFVRNPIDRLISAFTYSAKNIRQPDNYHWEDYGKAYRVMSKYIDENDPASFKRFVISRDFDRIFNHGWPVHFQPQHSFLMHNGNLEMDFVGNVKHLQRDLNHVFRALSLEEIREVSTENRSNFNHIDSFLDQNILNRILRKYHMDSKLWKSINI